MTEEEFKPLWVKVVRYGSCGYLPIRCDLYPDCDNSCISRSGDSLCGSCCSDPVYVAGRGHFIQCQSTKGLDNLPSSVIFLAGPINE